MNDTQIYSIIMFFAGVVLTHTVFYFDRKIKKQKFYIVMSATILQILDSVYSVHMASIEFANEEIKSVEETERQEYLQKESQKVSVFMELYVLLFIKAVPQEGRKYINYKTWPEAKALISELRGFMQNDKSKR